MRSSIPTHVLPVAATRAAQRGYLALCVVVALTALVTYALAARSFGLHSAHTATQADAPLWFH